MRSAFSVTGGGMSNWFPASLMCGREGFEASALKPWAMRSYELKEKESGKNVYDKKR